MDFEVSFVGGDICILSGVCICFVGVGVVVMCIWLFGLSMIVVVFEGFRLG